MVQPKCKTGPYGTKRWFLDTGELHREDGPAEEWENGGKFWYRHGEPHREDGAAAEYSDGTKCWYLNGKAHREDGPAVEYPDGKKKYWFEGRPIRKSDYPFIKLMKVLKIENIKLIKKMVEDEPEMYSSWLMRL